MSAWRLILATLTITLLAVLVAACNPTPTAAPASAMISTSALDFTSTPTQTPAGTLSNSSAYGHTHLLADADHYAHPPFPGGTIPRINHAPFVGDGG